MAYYLRAIDREGNITFGAKPLFYTGKAGMDWLSFDRNNAFKWETKEAANWKAKSFNRMEPVHGYWFLVDGVVEVS